LYLEALQRFDRALRQRNALLRRTGPHGAEQPVMLDALRRHLEAFEQPMAEAAVMVTERRAAALDRLSAAATEAYRMISGGAEALKLQYRPALAIDHTDHQPAEAAQLLTNTNVPARAYLQRLHDGLAQDLRRGSTQHGPHRDDFTVTLDGRDARDFASQGQQRSCVLALRLAEIDWMREATGEPPLLLLDDIVSELDEQRRARLLEAIPPDVQTFMTATNAEVLEGRFRGTRHFEVRQGTLATQTPQPPQAVAETGSHPQQNAK
jgi:DNA replication and repair protein RecF